MLYYMLYGANSYEDANARNQIQGFHVQCCLYFKQEWQSSKCKAEQGQELFCAWTCARVKVGVIESLSKGVLERRTSTGSKAFSLLTCLDDIKFEFLSFFTVREVIWLKIWAKPPFKNEKRSLPVDVRRSKTSLLKLPNIVMVI